MTMSRRLWLMLASFLLALVWTSQLTAQGPRPPKTIAFRTSEGTNLACDISPDGRSVVFDLLGQLWLLPASGGAARPITDAVRDSAEDNDPSFSSDGHRVLFQGERNGRTGLWLLNLDSGEVRQLTQLEHPEGFDGNAAWSPDGKTIAFAHIVFSTAPGVRPRSAIMLLDVTSGNVRELSITGLPAPNASDPVWLPDGKRNRFVPH